MSTPVNQVIKGSHSNDMGMCDSSVSKRTALTALGSSMPKVLNSDKTSDTPPTSIFKRIVTCIGKSLLGVIVVPVVTIAFSLCCFVSGAIVFGNCVAERAFKAHPIIGCVALVTVVPIVAIVSGVYVFIAGGMTGLSDSVSMVRSLSTSKIRYDFGDLVNDINSAVDWLN